MSLRVLASSTSSLKFLTGKSGLTTSMLPPPPPMRAIGVMSPSGSTAGLSISNLLATVAAVKLTSRVWPSGAARATSAVATMPVAPGLLSTTTLVPSSLLSHSAMNRLKMSAPPPGPLGMTRRIGLPAGQADWARAAGVANAVPRAPSAASTLRRWEEVISVSLDSGLVMVCRSWRNQAVREGIELNPLHRPSRVRSHLSR